MDTRPSNVPVCLFQHTRIYLILSLANSTIGIIPPKKVFVNSFFKIFTGIFPEETKIPSTNEISALLNINPHTVLKGMNMLVDEEIIYKKRGLGMYVKDGAVKKIRQKRQSQFYNQYVAALIEEASKLQMTKEDVIKLIERGYEDGLNSD